MCDTSQRTTQIQADSALAHLKTILHAQEAMTVSLGNLVDSWEELDGPERIAIGRIAPKLTIHILTLAAQ